MFVLLSIDFRVDTLTSVLVALCQSSDKSPAYAGIPFIDFKIMILAKIIFKIKLLI